MPYKPITNFSEANVELFSIADQIEKKTSELEDARLKYLESKVISERDYSKFLLTEKLNHPDMVQSEIIAKAKVLSFEIEMAKVKAESSYRRLQNEIKSLRDKLSVYQEISWNLRRERIQG